MNRTKHKVQALASLGSKSQRARTRYETKNKEEQAGKQKHTTHDVTER